MGEYLDGTLPLRRRRGVEAHLQTCAACRSEMETMRRTLALLSDLPRREVSDGFETMLRARLAGLDPARQRPARFRLPVPAFLLPSARHLRAPWPSEWRRLVPMGALAAAAVALAAWNFQPGSTGPVPTPPPLAYVTMVVQEHQVLGAGSDMNSTVVSHNLGGDALGDDDAE